VITLHAEDTELFVEAGDTIELVVRVRNDGTLVERVRISVGGTATGFAVPPAETIPIFPAAEESAVVRFSPPRDSSLPAGRYNFTVRAASTVHQGVNRVVNGEVTVGGFLVTSASLSPESTRGRRRKFTHVLSLDNQGDMPWHVNVTAVDTSGSLIFDGSPVTVEVPLGTSSIVKLNGRAPTRWIGGTEQLPFQVKTGPVPGTVDTGDHRVMPATRMQIAWIPRWLPPALVAVLALAIAAWAVFGPGDVKVPAVAGKAFTDAVAALQAEGFEVTPQQVSDQIVASGTAIRTDPSAGTPADEGSNVTLIVSTGPVEGKTTIPPVRGLSAEEAEALLEGVDLKVRQELEASDLVAGQALDTIPTAGFEADPGQEVVLLVSSGAAPADETTAPSGPMPLPNLVGKTEEEAREILAGLDLGLVPHITEEVSDDVAVGLVARTEPTGGDEVKAGDTVTLVVSTGQPGDLIQLAQQARWVDAFDEPVRVGDPPSREGYVAFEENVVAEDGKTVDALVTRPAPSGGELIGTLVLDEPLSEDVSMVGMVGFRDIDRLDVEARFTITAIFPNNTEREIANFISDNADTNPRDLSNDNLVVPEGTKRIQLKVSELNVDDADPLWIELTME
jgi:beta-lactam-binding protein with PASTA domain